METYSKGLEGVIVDETKISHVEGDAGRLSYRGYCIEDLVKLPFPQVTWLVLFGQFPTEVQEKALVEFFKANGTLTPKETALLQSLDRKIHPMVMLQSIVPLLDLVPKQKIDLPTAEPEAHAGLVIIAKLPALIAGFHQHLQGNPLPEVDPALDYHGNFLAMFNDKKASQEQINVLDVTQILQMEHSFNAGTFAGRVTASTLSPVQCVISASIGTLYGKLHGGADQAALEMALQVGSPENAEAFVENALQHKQKIMGMGHREYKTLDPRAKILKPMAEKLNRGTSYENLLQTLIAVEAAFHQAMQQKNKALWANVEYYKGAVFYSLGIPPQFFTALFAMSRSVGYLAHFIESRQDNRLIRPKALYTGRKITQLSA